MTESEDDADTIALLMGDAEPGDALEAQANLRLTAELQARLDAGEDEAMANDNDLAALVDGRLAAADAARQLGGPQGRARVEAALAFAAAASAAAMPIPPALAAAARRRLHEGDHQLVPLRPAPRPTSPPEVFLPLAAAHGSTDQAIVCRSTSGLWTLQTFPGMSAADRAAGRASLLVTISPEHAASYEGLMLRAFVTAGGEERVLAEAVVRDGAAFAEISIAGLDLRNRDPISVIFITPDGA